MEFKLEKVLKVEMKEDDLEEIVDNVGVLIEANVDGVSDIWFYDLSYTGDYWNAYEIDVNCLKLLQKHLFNLYIVNEILEKVNELNGVDKIILIGEN